MISVELDGLTAVITTLEVLPATIDAEAAKAMEVSVFMVEAQVKSLTPRKTGRLFSAWSSSVRLTPGLTGIVANNVSYAPFIEEGTRPHDIWAKPGSALMWPGADHPVSHVRHPGFVGRHMAKLALSISTPAIAAEFRRAIKRAVEIALGK